MTSPAAQERRPLDRVGSIKVKIGLLVALSILAAALVLQAGRWAGVPAWLTLPVTVAGALTVTLWLSRGMTSPLREMTQAAARMATGDHSRRVTATSADEVGELARAFNTMAQDLATVDRQRRELLATVSHELRTPLAGQRALLENLVDGVVRPDDAALQAALAQSERLSDLVQDLLDVSRVDGGAAPLELAPVEVPALLERAVAEARVGGRKVLFEIDVQPAGLVVHADAARLAQVVANLLDNAVRHSPPGGRVTLRARVEDARTWSLEVADDGPGIPAEQAERVFTRFGMADDRAGGTGLGLAIARWVCELHGGSITSLPAPAGRCGARLRAVLPRTPTATATSRPAAPAPLPSEPAPGEPTVRPAPAPSRPAAPAAASGIPSGSLVDSLFGDFWPERGLRAAPVALYCSLGIGFLAAVVLPFRDIGLGVLLVLLLAGALVLHQSVRRSRPWTVLSSVLCLMLGVLVVLRAAEWLAVLAVMLAAVLVATALTGARGLPAMVAGAASWVLAGVRGLPLLGRTLSTTSTHTLIWPVLRTAAISLAALVVFGGLLGTAEPVLGQWLAWLQPDIDVQFADELVFRAFVLFVVGGVVLAGCYLALNPPRVDRVRLPEPRPVTRAWEWVVPVSVVVALYAAFHVAQASALWGGHDYVERTTGLTYATYVHQGFGQLTVATALTLLTVALTVRKAARGTPRDRLVLRVVLGVLCLLTLAVVASALYRMSLYQQTYGFTVLRVLVDAFELWLGVILVLVMVAGVRLSAGWLPRAALASAAGFVVVLGLANPEAWVAQRNLERYQATGRLDLAYLSTLGDDAAPVIAVGLPEDLARCALSGAQEEGADDLLSWNLGRARADAVDLTPADHRVSCPAELG